MHEPTEEARAAGVVLMWVLAMIGAWSTILTLDASAVGGLNRQAQPVTVLDDDDDADDDSGHGDDDGAEDGDETGEDDGEEDADEESAV